MGNEANLAHVEALLPAIDTFIGKCNAARTDPELRSIFTTQPGFDIGTPVGEPDSDEYRQSILAIYRVLAGKPYHLENE